MRILVLEFASGGGFAGREVPASLAREGSAMLTALVSDLAAIRHHDIVTTEDPRFPLAAPPGVEVVTLRSHGRTLNGLMDSADAVWLVAPETDRCLERLAAKAERKRKTLLGPGAAAIRRASDKASLPGRLARFGVLHPKTRVLRSEEEWRISALEIGFPMVVKPARGAGCEGVSLARDARELRQAVHGHFQTHEGVSLLLQRYVAGVPASVSLLADGSRAVALAVNAQSVRASRRFSYHGGRTPLDHPLTEQAVEAALRACRALPGLRGYVGVDVVLTGTDAVVIEVNPRLTTAYLGVRAALGTDGGTARNVAAMALAACAGVLPALPPVRRCVRFTSAGRIISVVPHRPEGRGGPRSGAMGSPRSATGGGGTRSPQ